MTFGPLFLVIATISICNRSQVQSSTFKVKDKEGIKEQRSSSKMLISPSNCQFSSKFWIRPDAEIGQNNSFRSSTKYVTQMHSVDEHRTLNP
jgi:hypothetical protein